ncbi:MAG: cardiolipin synthase [Planctomycetota bacterium]
MPDSHIGAILTAVVMLHAAAIAAGILTERRQPAAKLAWFLTLFYLPVLGVLLYLLFGRLRPRLRLRKRMRSNISHMRSAGTLPSALQLQTHEIPAALRGLIELTRRTSGAAISTGDEATILFEGASKIVKLLDAIGEAREYVHLEYYIFRPDRTGEMVRDALVAALQRGVAVRFMWDGAGSYGLDRRFLEPLEEAGGHVAVFLPIRLPLFTDRRDFRNHRKLAIVDGETGFVGGMNIGDEYLGETAGRPHWRDCHLRLVGPAVQDLERIFEEDWFHATGEEIEWGEDRPSRPGDDIVQIVSSGPDRPWPTFQQAIFTVISSAQKNVWITTPYFVPDESIVMALQTAAFRGVDVRLLVPRKSDLPMMTITNRSYYLPLLEAGVRIFEYTGGMIHAKTITADGLYSLVGSANMDRRSFRLNFEVCVSIMGRRCAAALETAFASDLARSREVALEEWRQRSRLERMLEAVAQLLSPLL